MLARRNLVVTVGVPGYAQHGSRPVQTNLAAMSFEVVSADMDAGERDADPMLEGEVEETDLHGGGYQDDLQGYWKMLNRLIARQMPSRTEIRHKPGRRGPIVGFRLYRNGEVQLIEIERSSGDADLDQAAVLAVVDAHPFPRIPASTPDPYITVHVSLPIPPR